MSDNIQLRIEIEDNGSIKKIKVNYDDLEKAIKRVKTTTDKLNDSMVNLASTTQALQNISSLIGKLADSFYDLTSAYEVQQAAETRLSQVMRNTMGASEAEVESIKALCSEQQKLGIIGDEVQLAAAQELATYLEMPASLKTLIPLMNDMAVQQYGVSASAESVTQIAAMMGKVMQGQTEALGRNGYRFSEAQKQILKYGNETERVAVLVEVCGSVVDGMNEKVGELPIGRLVQVRNAWGDIKETIGSITVYFQKYLNVLGRLGMSASGFFQIQAAFQAAGKSLSSWLKKSPIAALSFKILDIQGRIASRGVDATRKAVNRLNIALASGIIGLIVTLGTLLFSLFSSSKKAKEGLEEVDEAVQAYNSAAGDMRGAIAGEIISLQQLKGQQEEEKKKVIELNQKYGEAFGIHQTAAEWYDTLINKSEDYCRQLGYEAKAKAYEKQLGEKLVKLDEQEDIVQDYIKNNGGREPLKYTIETQENFAAYQEGQGPSTPLVTKRITDYGKAVEDRDHTRSDVDDLMDKVQTAASKAKEAGDKVNGGRTQPTTPPPSKEDPYNGKQLIQSPVNEKGLQNNVKFFENQLAEANAADTENFQQLIEGYILAQQALEDYKKAKDKAMLEAQKPEEIKSVDDIQSLDQVNQAIEYQQKLRNSASAKNLKNIDAEIKRLNDLKTAFEDSTHVELKTEEIKTYKQLEDEISFYNRQLKTASDADRKKIQAHIVELEDLKKKWDDVLEEISKPGDISTLNTIEKLDEAISWYGQKQKKVSEQGYLDIQKIINALQQKKNLMEAPAANEAKIAEMQVETSQLSGLEGNSLKMKLELIGLDGVAQKIREIQQMMNDPSATEDHKKALKDLRNQYVGYYKDLLKTDKGMIQSWGTVKGLGNSIEGMTESIKGQGNAWKKISGIIDSTISLYQSISQIIEIVKMLTSVTKIQEGAEKAKGQASLLAGTNALVGSEQQVSASMSNTIANETETVSAEGKALAEGVSSASGIPFPYNLIAIGVTVAAVIAALMTSLPKLASGGIATGPTLALVGEYPGASTNPEVIMPANKLKGLLREDLGIGGNVTFRIEGRNLVGVLGKESHYRSRR